MKKVFALILAFAMLLCAMAFAEEVEPQVTTLDPAVEMYVQAIRGLRLRSEMDLTNDENIIRILGLNETVLVDSITNDEWAHVTYELPEEEQTEEVKTIEGYMWYEYLGEEPYEFTSTAKTDTRTIIVYGVWTGVDDDGYDVYEDIEMTKEEYVEYRVLTDPRFDEALDLADAWVEEMIEEAEATFDEIYYEQHPEVDPEEEEVSYEATIMMPIPLFDENGDPVIGEDGEPVYEEVEMTKEEYIDLFVEIYYEEADQEIIMPVVDEIIAEAEAEFEVIYEAQQKGIKSSDVVWVPVIDEETKEEIGEEPVVLEPEEEPAEEPAEEPVVEEPVVEEPVVEE